MSKDKNYFDRIYRGVKNSIRIDSLKLRIPMNIVEILDTSILDHFAEANLKTGEINPNTFKLKSKEYNFSNTCKVKVLIEKRVTSIGNAEDCLMIYLNSKILRERYFEGLHYDIIKTVYEDLMSLKVFSIEFESFLQAQCTDIDFKFDEVMTESEWISILSEFKSLTKVSAKNGKGYTEFNPTKNDPYQRGLMYNNRAKATISNPFFKLYWKGGELLSKSRDFYEEHLSKIDKESLLKIVRIETTVKNKKHASSLGIDNTSLLGLLTIKEEVKEQMFRKILDKHLDRLKRNSKLNSEAPKESLLNPTEISMYTSMVMLMNATNYTYDEVIEGLIQHQTTREKVRKRKQYSRIYNDFVKGGKTDLKVKKSNSFLTKFGWL